MFAEMIMVIHIPMVINNPVLCTYGDFPGGSDGKASAYNALNLACGSSYLMSLGSSNWRGKM